MYVCAHVCVCVYVRVCMCVRVRARVYVCACVCACVRACVYVCVYLFVYVNFVRFPKLQSSEKSVKTLNIFERLQSNNVSPAFSTPS